MHPSIKEHPLLLYLTSTDKSICALLAQEIDGQERPIYYLSRLVRDAESRYSAIERHCLALTFIAKKFRHYFIAHPIYLITCCEPYQHLLSKPIFSGKASHWLLVISEFDITRHPPWAIRSQSLADRLAQFPEQWHEPLDNAFPLDELQVAIAHASHDEWQLAFDGSSTCTGGRVGVILTSPTQQITAAFKLAFHYSNNESEYEVTGEYAIREPLLASYRAIIQRLFAQFYFVRFTHVPRFNNRYLDALATLVSAPKRPKRFSKLPMNSTVLPLSHCIGDSSARVITGPIWLYRRTPSKAPTRSVKP
ncbi:uncharacterized protein LOC132272461 [Cornus florida]|uniref:uncharacterized protein LOC132272461 n=1 Tax=Cornus florida TaxID=4283 RepID=UPI002897DA58|nr:uncharacterized protein LOC132272461 [Cornus florida]